MNKKKKILRTETVNKVAIITLDTPGEKINKLNEQLIDEFSDLLDEFESDDAIEGALLLSGKENNFIAGADIEMFTSRETAEELSELSWTGHKILLRIESFDKPIVAGIHGSCMGGGTELALACHYRIVTDHKSTKIGLPEVKLGLTPGMGGTQRLPRLIGIQKALPYLLTGKNMYSFQAGKTGFADELVHQYAIKDAGIEAVKKLNHENVNHPDKRSFLEKVSESTSIGRKIIFDQARKRTRQETKGNYPAPPKIIESVEFGFKHGFEKGLKNESKLFGKLATTPESRALVQLFFAMNESKKNPMEKKNQTVHKMGVLGAGLMGSGITEVSIDDGIHVWLKDQNIGNAMKGENTIRENLDVKVGKHILSDFERDEKMSRIHPTESYEGFKDLDIVIEAVFEDLNLKRTIVDEIENVCSENTIFASNTSSIPISDIAKEAERPGNIVGMHYFSPVQKMPLLEIIKTDKTEDWVVATAFDIGLRQGKNVIVVNDGPGFYTTRILAPYINEALLMLEEGAEIEDLDKAMKNYGFPVGPIALLDEVGIDVGAHVAETLSDKFEERGAKTSKKSKELVEDDYLGRKNKRGFYIYEEESKKKKQVNTDIYRYFGGKIRESFDREEIQDRLATMMINEAVLCLQEEILQNPTDGDLGAILGLGFPPFLGGPFRYIDRMGVESFLEKMHTLSSNHSDRFKPADHLLTMKANQSLFHPEDQ